MAAPEDEDEEEARVNRLKLRSLPEFVVYKVLRLRGGSPDADDGNVEDPNQDDYDSRNDSDDLPLPPPPALPAPPRTPSLHHSVAFPLPHFRTFPEPLTCVELRNPRTRTMSPILGLILQSQAEMAPSRGTST